MKRLLCMLFGHRWLVNAHVVPIIGQFLNSGRDRRHPFSQHRYGYYGFALSDVYSSKILHPLAGCRAMCARCKRQWDDTEPEASTMLSSVKRLDIPLLVIAR